ncbi:MFS transporter [Nocardia sp. NPDC051832]|uniref:MFS transporter n=1 Tax=Nocardia sp. NPDC051832 TaxID=3155673 RepID=UPI00341318E8
MSLFAWDNYRHVFAPAGAFALTVAGVMSRAGLSTIGLGILQLVSDKYGGYWLAGVACGTYMVCAAIGGIYWGRLADIRGQRWVLHRTALILVVGAFGMVLAVSRKGSVTDLLIAAVIIGVGIPPAGAMVRARWTRMHAETPSLGVAYSLESSLEEALFTIGPPVMGFLHLVNPSIGLPIVVAINLVGMLWLAAQPGTEPPLVTTGPQRNLAVLVRGMPILFVVSFSYGGMLGALDVAVIAFAVSRGHELIGLVALALWTAASVVGGMIYGAMRQTVATNRRFILATTLVWVAVVPLLFVHDLGPMTVLLAIGGTSMAPAMAVVTGLAEQISPRQSLTVALAWISTGTGLGAAVGTVIQGWAADWVGRQPMFVVTIAFASLATAVAWTGAASLRPTRPRVSAITPWSG